jgi:DedD protein
MEIDEKLKNRVAGTVVVTVLAIIFLPMLFESPIDKKAQVISEPVIPKPEKSPLLDATIVPDTPAEVIKPQTPETVVSSAVEIPSVPTPKIDKVDSSSHPEVVKSVAENAGAAAVKKKQHKNEPEPAATVVNDVIKSTKKPKGEPPSLAEDVAAVEKSEAVVTDKHHSVVQVASLTDSGKANALRDKLVGQGFSAKVESALLNGKQYYRIKVATRSEAEKGKLMQSVH